MRMLFRLRALAMVAPACAIMVLLQSVVAETVVHVAAALPLE